jgi:predicted carbohydrate-binding protein with CBM5 and CBM33 domain
LLSNTFFSVLDHHTLFTIQFGPSVLDLLLESTFFQNSSKQDQLFRQTFHNQHLLSFKMKYSASILAGFLTTVSAHGRITSPTPRLARSAMQAACGEQVYNNQASDSYGNIQGELQIAATQTDYKAAECGIWLCKGYKYADNTANVQSYTAGQVVPFTFDVRAPHTGTANVSIVNTATNSIIGDILLYYPDFADNAKTIPANETSFSITIPSDLGDTCSTAGTCVIQHWWNAASTDQTYESCVDFTVGGSESSSGSSNSSVTVSVVTTSAVVASSSAVTTSAAVTSSSAPVGIVSSSAVPTTLRTMVSSASTTAASSTSAAAGATSTEVPDDDDDC